MVQPRISEATGGPMPRIELTVLSARSRLCAISGTEMAIAGSSLSPYWLRVSSDL